MVEIPMVEIVHTSMFPQTGVHIYQHDNEKFDNNPGYFMKDATTFVTAGFSPRMNKQICRVLAIFLHLMEVLRCNQSYLCYWVAKMVTKPKR